MIVLAIVVCIKLGHEGVDVDRQAKPAHRLAKRSQTNRSALVLISTMSNIGYARRRGRRGRKRSETIKAACRGEGRIPRTQRMAARPAGATLTDNNNNNNNNNRTFQCVKIFGVRRPPL